MHAPRYGPLSATADGQRSPADQPPVVADTELVRLVRELPQGDPRREAAYEELINRFRPVVHGYARRYRHSPEAQEELIQAGYIGLLTAINNFDPAVGSSLLAYARPCIGGEIKRHFRDKRWQIRVHRSAQELRAQVLRCEDELIQRLGRLPTEAEVAEELHLERSAIAEARAADQAFHPLSLDAPFSADAEGSTLGDFIGGTDEHLETILGMASVWPHLAELSEREQMIVKLRFYGNMTQSQIAQRIGISQMHVSRLLAHSIGYLRDKIVNGDQRQDGATTRAGRSRTAPRQPQPSAQSAAAAGLSGLPPSGAAARHVPRWHNWPAASRSHPRCDA